MQDILHCQTSEGKVRMLLENRLAAETTQFAMGTVITHRAFGPYAEDCLDAVCREVERIEGLLSRFLPGSDIHRLNASAGIKSEKVSPETFEVISKAAEFSRYCQGCFDVTIEPLVSLWNIRKEPFVEPDRFSIMQVLPLVNFRDLILDPWDMTAGLRYTGQSVDLGGIGKGYAADRIIAIYDEYGINSAYSNLGGNVVTRGAKPDGSPWIIGIQHPRQEDRLIGAVSVVNQTVVTSGDYQRCVIGSQGERHHHILNPATGYPAESGLISVSIVTENSLAADALSTMLFVAGLEKGLRVLESFPRAEAILVDSELRIYITSGLQYCFQAGQGFEVTILN
jgi:FAD:protein FMN transferase